MTSIQTDQNIVYTIAEGQLDDEDYNRIIPLLKEKIESFGKVRWYFEMKDFTGWTFSAMWKDLKFDVKNRNNLERVAMVGDKTWEKQLTQLMKPFTEAEIKFYESEDREKARYWIKAITDEDQ
ncbi:STAS/SEC14 domain-containing protein [Salinimicrobium catena]|uniref:STAS/SEC14 domain-containing protein n=1 Tax=Salinimicrobium catena TaxID=390640 RepID=UPI002FE47F41